MLLLITKAVSEQLRTGKFFSCHLCHSSDFRLNLSKTFILLLKNNWLTDCV